MRSHHLSIGLLMTAVAILALDLALLRLALAYRGPDLAAMYGPIGLAVQFGLICAVRGRREGHLFWVGFVAAGIGAAIGSAWLDLARPRPVNDLWIGYLALLDSLFGRLPRLGSSNPGHEGLHFGVVALFFAPAQLFLASAGGILATGLSGGSNRRTGRWHAADPPDRASERTPR